MHGTKEELVKILEDIKDMVIVTGSYARNAQTLLSDIDMYIKPLPEDETDYENGIETYCQALISYFENLGFTWDSCFVESFSVDDTYVPLEFSAFYTIDDKIFDIDVFGVKMKASKSSYTGKNYVNGEKQKRR